MCAPDVGWRYHPKNVEEFTKINKLCNVATCWIYIGIDSLVSVIPGTIDQMHQAEGSEWAIYTTVFRALPYCV